MEKKERDFHNDTGKKENHDHNRDRESKKNYGWIWTTLFIVLASIAAISLLIRWGYIERPNWFDVPDRTPLTEPNPNVPNPIFPDREYGEDIDGDGEKENINESNDDLTDPTEVEKSADDMILGDEGVSEGLGIQPFALKRSYPNSAVAKMNGSYVNNVIHWAHKYLGTPYEYGSNRNNPKTFDCSDFVRWTHLISVGYVLPADSRQQQTYAESFAKAKTYNIRQAKKGDLLFFMSYKGWKQTDYKGINPRNQTTTHVGIYLGNGKMIHTASKESGGVRIDDVFGKHYEWRFKGAYSIL